MTPEETLGRMEAAADQFYTLAVATNCHAYIEFTGLLREYCKVCRENLARGIDFRELNGHRSERMELQPYELHYFQEKLNCIFQGLLVVKAEGQKFPVASEHSVTVELSECSVNEYAPAGTAAGDYRYYRFTYWDGQRIHHTHIPGGNVGSILAQSRAIEVRSAIAKGISPPEIVEMIRRW